MQISPIDQALHISLGFPCFLLQSCGCSVHTDVGSDNHVKTSENEQLFEQLLASIEDLCSM
jgi:hypothetical protein